MMNKFTSQQNIWFTSDTHYWHKNIAYDSSVWPHKETSTRKLGDVKEMSRHIVDQINKYVGQEDILFHLGDWSFGGIENIWNFRKQLLCQNVHLVFGNHDHHIVQNRVLPNCIIDFISDAVISGSPAHDGQYVLAKELFKSSNHYLEIQIDKEMFCLMHYPIESWNRGFIHLHGHTHTLAPIKQKRLDVGIDNAFKLFGEYKPFSLKEILKLTQ